MAHNKCSCSTPLVCYYNSMVFTSHSGPFPVTRDLRSLVAGNGTLGEPNSNSFSEHQCRYEHLLCAIVPPSGVVNDMNSEMVYQVWNQVK